MTPAFMPSKLACKGATIDALASLPTPNDAELIGEQNIALVKWAQDQDIIDSDFQHNDALTRETWVQWIAKTGLYDEYVARRSALDPAFGPQCSFDATSNGVPFPADNDGSHLTYTAGQIAIDSTALQKKTNSEQRKWCEAYKAGFLVARAAPANTAVDPNASKPGAFVPGTPSKPPSTQQPANTSTLASLDIDGPMQTGEVYAAVAHAFQLPEEIKTGAGSPANGNNLEPKLLVDNSSSVTTTSVEQLSRIMPTQVIAQTLYDHAVVTARFMNKSGLDLQRSMTLLEGLQILHVMTRKDTCVIHMNADGIVEEDTN
ncbi:MAG: hypothetical protein ACPGUV_02075 [Polyangiales bacterium]